MCHRPDGVSRAGLYGLMTKRLTHVTADHQTGDKGCDMTMTDHEMTQSEGFIGELDSSIVDSAGQQQLSVSRVVDTLLDLYNATRRVAVRRLIGQHLAAVSTHNAIERAEFVDRLENIHDASVIESAFDRLALI